MVEARLTGNGLVSGLYATGRNDGVGAARSKFVMDRTEVSEASFVDSNNRQVATAMSIVSCPLFLACRSS